MCFTMLFDRSAGTEVLGKKMSDRDYILGDRQQAKLRAETALSLIAWNAHEMDQAKTYQIKVQAFTIMSTLYLCVFFL